MSGTYLVVPSNRMDQLVEFFAAWEGKGGWDQAIVVQDAPERTDLGINDNPPLHYSHAEIGSILGPDAWIISRRDSACRCFGFLVAYHLGADRVITLDDDTRPRGDCDDFTAAHAKAMVHPRWTSSMEPHQFRGLPYRNRGVLPDVVANMGFWSGVADYDAPRSLVTAADQSRFEPEKGNRVLPRGQFSPVCGMNLCVERKALPLFYFPLMGEGQPYSRFDDIWAGVIAKHCIDALGWHISVGEPFVEHKRASDPFVNLRKEAPGIGANETFWETVAACDLCLPESATEAVSRLARCLRTHGGNVEPYVAKLGDALQVWARLFRERPVGL